MKKMKHVAAFALAAVMTMGTVMTSMASGWQLDTTGWWYQRDDGSYPLNSWNWIDGNQDGVAECYYFGSDGYILTDTVTPDGYQVDGNGAWVIDGSVQTRGGFVSSELETGYNSDGINNAAIDILNHIQTENAKYGESAVYQDSTAYGDVTRVFYHNGLIAEYYASGIYYENGKPNVVYAMTPSMILDGVNDTITDAESAESNLRGNRFEHTYQNGTSAWFIEDELCAIWNPTMGTVRLSLTK